MLQLLRIQLSSFACSGIAGCLIGPSKGNTLRNREAFPVVYSTSFWYIVYQSQNSLISCRTLTRPRGLRWLRGRGDGLRGNCDAQYHLDELSNRKGCQQILSKHLLPTPAQYHAGKQLRGRVMSSKDLVSLLHVEGLLAGAHVMNQNLQHWLQNLQFFIADSDTLECVMVGFSRSLVHDNLSAAKPSLRCYCH